MIAVGLVGLYVCGVGVVAASVSRYLEVRSRKVRVEPEELWFPPTWEEQRALTSTAREGHLTTVF